MSAHDRTEFERLLAAHCNRDLDERGNARLRKLAAGDAAQRREVAGIDRLHGVLADERALFETVRRPPDARDEADPVYARLATRAARAEQELRSRLLDIPIVPVRSRPAWLRAVGAAAAVLAISIGVQVWWPRTPDRSTLQRPANILLTPDATRAMSWHAVPGARSYDVVISDADNDVVLERPAPQSRSTSWELSAAERQRLLAIEAERGPLYLRVVARDGGGLEVGTTGDRALTLR